MKKTTRTQKATETKIAEIARTHLGVETLATRNRDALDFYDLGVASLRNALLAAYEAGANQK